MLQRVRALAGRTPLDIWLLIAILLFGALLRLWLTVTWFPVMLGFPDSSAYLSSVRVPFSDQARPDGYPAFVSLLWHVRPSFLLVVSVQHLMGLATALLAWLITWRLGAPRWAGLIPAAVASFGGAVILLEHAILTEALFSFLVIVALAAAVFSATSDRGRPGLPLLLAALAGLVVGLAVNVRTVAALMLPLVLLYLVVGGDRDARDGWRIRLLSPLIALACCGVAVFAMLAWHNHKVGGYAQTTTQFYNTYGRVATFVDCSKFTPPKGTEFLCPDTPVSERPGTGYWVFTGGPIVERWLNSYESTAPPELSKQVRSFAISAVLHQPGAYLREVSREVWRLFDDDFPRNPNPVIGNAGTGASAGELRDRMRDPVWTDTALQQHLGVRMADWGRYRSLNGFYAWESVTRFSGLRLALLLLLAVAGTALARPGRMRRGALLAAGSGAVLLFAPILISEYNFRYTVTTFPPLAIAAGIGCAELIRRLRSRRGPDRPSPRPAA